MKTWRDALEYVKSLKSLLNKTISDKEWKESRIQQMTVKIESMTKDVAVQDMLDKELSPKAKELIQMIQKLEKMLSDETIN